MSIGYGVPKYDEVTVKSKTDITNASKGKRTMCHKAFFITIMIRNEHNHKPSHGKNRSCDLMVQLL